MTRQNNLPQYIILFQMSKSNDVDEEKRRKIEVRFI